MKPHLAIRFLALLVCGCTYTSKPLTRANVHTVHLPIFDNRTFRRGLEFRLTEAIKNELLYKTDLKIVDLDHADTVLTGEIVDVRESVLMEDLKDDIVETSVTVTVDIMWRDRRTNRVILDRRGICDTAKFVLLRGENVGTATDEAFRDLAEHIVESLQEDW